MAYSRVIKISDGSTDEYTVNFADGFISESDVTAHVEGEVDGLGDPIYRTITFLSTNLLKISGAIPPLNTKVIFDRTVLKTDTLVHFTNGDVMDEENLDLSFKQILMVAHEALDGRIDRFSNDLSMGNFRITDLGEPVDDQDAATKNYVDDKIVAADGATAAAIAAAAASQASSLNSASSAAASANSAAISATHSINAGTSAGLAEDSAEEAALYAGQAAASAGAASGSASSAAASVVAAQDIVDDLNASLPLDIGAAIAAAGPKDPLVDADKFAVIDSEAGNAIKTFTWANVKARLKTYFDTLYYGKGVDLIVQTAGATIVESRGATAFMRLRSTLGGILDYGLSSDGSFNWTRYTSAGVPVDVPISVGVDGAVNFSDLPYHNSIPLVPAERNIAVGVALSTAVISGSYRLSSAHPDLPTDYNGSLVSIGAFGQLVVARGADTIEQTIKGYDGSKLTAPYTRTGYGIGGGSPIWTPWRRYIIQDTTRTGGDAHLNNLLPGFFKADAGGPVGGAPMTGPPAWYGIQSGDPARGMQLTTGYGANDLWFRNGTDGWNTWRRTWDNLNLPVTPYGAGIVNAPDAASARAYLDVTGGGGGTAGVTTFNGRAGNVAPLAGDYNTSMISYSGQTQSFWNDLFNKKMPWVTPEMYGAVGDGSANDTPAFQAMIDAASARGAIVFLGAKKYRWNSTVTIDKKTMKWVGSGGFGTLRGTSIEFYGTGSSNALQVIDGGGSVFEDFTIIRLGGNSTGTLLDIDGYYNAIPAKVGWNLIRLMGLNLDAQGYGRAAHFKMGFYLRANHCRFVFGGIAGRETVLLNGVSDDRRMDNCEFIQCHFAGDQNGAANVVDSIGIDGFANSMKFIQCGILYGKHGIRIRDSYGSTGGTAFLYISNGGFENNMGTSLLIDGPAEKIILNGAYLSNDGDESNIRSTSNIISGTFASDGGGEIHISGCHIRGAGLHGIDATHGTWTITGNRIVNNNRIGSTGYGVIVRSGVTDCQITGNRIGRTRNRVSPTHVAGVRNDLGAACVISSNDLRGNTTAISGTTTGPGIGLNVT